MTGELREKCAVVGVANAGDQASAMAYEALLALQHRGSEAAGIATLGNGFRHYEAGGMVRDVFSEGAIRTLLGNTAVGHNRYSTQGGTDGHHQPFIDEHTGFAFAHNGNLPVTDNMQTYLEANGIRNVYNDSEMMGLTIAQFIRQGQSLPNAVRLSVSYFRGSFSCVAMHDNILVAFRDNRGIRPLALGTRESGEIIVSSETCGLDIVGAKYLREVRPGEMVVITDDFEDSVQLTDEKPAFDMFELVYFSRPDSLFNGESINEIRRRFGEQLAEEHPPTEEDTSNILVVPVPDTSIPAAEAYAEKLGLAYSQSIVKNRYVGRTFMDTTQDARLTSLSRKHAVVPERIKGRDVVVVDDSIVRLNTMPGLVTKIKAAGARSVKVIISSPPVRFPDFYGIDTPAQEELIAFCNTTEQIRERIGSEYLGYLSLSGTVKAANMPYNAFNLSCFNGEYPISIGKRTSEVNAPVSTEYLD